MDLRKRLSTKENPEHSAGEGNNGWRWVLFTALLLLLVLIAAPYISDSRMFELSCYRGYHRPAEAATGVCLPENAAIISINREGVVRVSTGEEMSLPVTSGEELHRFVHLVLSTYPGRAFVLKIDKEIPYEKVDQVLSALNTAGVHDVYFHTVLPDPW